jgi:hypothetical protein
MKHAYTVAKQPTQFKRQASSKDMQNCRRKDHVALMTVWKIVLKYIDMVCTRAHMCTRVCLCLCVRVCMRAQGSAI